MKVKAVLFDLDGTLLPMDQDLFIKTYLKLLAAKMAPKGYDPKTLMEALWLGVADMVKNDGSMLNEEVFWKRFSSMLGEQVINEKPVLEEFYKNEFHQAKAVCGSNTYAKEMVNGLKEKGYKVILATNPIFPAVATISRMSWVGLSPEDFDYYTTYENSRFSKPNLKYYQDILEKNGLNPEECLMIGNDVSEDMITEKLGMKVYLLTDCIINKNNEDVSEYDKGSILELKQYLDNM